MTDAEAPDDVSGGVSADGQPTLATIVRLVEQTITEQQETRARLDSQSQIMSLRFEAFQKQLDSSDDRHRADFLTLSNDIADVRRHVGTIEEHVGFLTTKVTEHDQRFDRIDTRLDGIDTRLDAIDTRFDHVDSRLDSLAEVTIQIRDAVLPPREG
ncbi:hypothetical protein ACWGJP_00555 [Microbacterium sp. NPDC055903]